ncbi:four helix bundle protein [Hydrogenimonas sp.]
MDANESVLRKKSYAFALRIVKLSRWLQDEKREFVLSRQLLRSGTAVGALIYEAEFAQSRADFINKLHIGLKEANEANYWLMLLHDAQYLNDRMFESIKPDADELVRLLVSSLKTLKTQS